MKEFLCSKWMATDEEAKETVMYWLNRLASNFYVEGFVRLVQRRDVPESQWDYIEK
jgi:hypothetical protein